MGCGVGWRFCCEWGMRNVSGFLIFGRYIMQARQSGCHACALRPPTIPPFSKALSQENAMRLLILVCLLALAHQTVAAELPSRTIDGKLQPSLAPIVAQATPAVVNISTYAVQRSSVSPLLQSPLFRHFFSLPDNFEEQRQMQTAGSGVIVDAAKGYVLTNHHVIAEADEIEVNLQDGRAIPAKLIGSDKKVDISLLQIQADNLSALPIANSRDLAVGDFVLAIGNPFGIGQTVTSGIISALGRNGLGIQG